MINMASLPFNQKVKTVLEHFANDDCFAVSDLAQQLLENYMEDGK